MWNKDALPTFFEQAASEASEAEIQLYGYDNQREPQRSHWGVLQ